jgi:hypothetical protein
MEVLQNCILGRWLHSHEEDTPEIRVYRPASYKFPPARGRRGFEFRAGGELIYYSIERTDGSQQISGRWIIEEPNRIKIHVSDERIKPFELDVVHCDHEMLKVR